MDAPDKRKVNATRIQQLPIDGSEVTSPPLNEIRARFLEKIGNFDKDFLLLNFNQWLQAPVSPTGKSDGDCEPRAKNLAPRLCKNSTKPANLGPNFATSVGGLEPKWKALDSHLDNGAAVTMKGLASQFGGSASKFEHGHHVVLFLAFGRDAGPPAQEGQGKLEEFYIAFDPDVCATTESQALWQKLLRQHETPTEKFPELSGEKLFAIMNGMIFGEGGGTGFGPLFRKYYPIKTMLMQSNTNALYDRFK